MISIVPTDVSQTGSWPRPWQVLALEMAVAVAAALALETALAVESALALGFRRIPLGGIYNYYMMTPTKSNHQ